MASAPLSGIVVVERAGRLAGAVTASLLANLGASVVRFDDVAGRPPSDPLHWHRHPLATEGKTIVHAALERDQRNAQWQELVRTADIVIQSAADDGAAPVNVPLTCVFTALGMAEATLGDDCGEMQLQALCGVMAVTGEAHQPPQIVATPILEIFAGINGATSAIAALRAGVPHGTVLDLAVYDSGVALLGTFHSSALAAPTRGFRDGCRHPLLSPWNVYRTADGWIMLCSTTDEHWQRLLVLMECTGLSNDPRFSETNIRVQNADAVDAIVGNWARQRTTADAIDALSKCAIPAGQVTTIPELIAQETKARRTREMVSDTGAAVVCPMPLFDIEPGARAPLPPSPDPRTPDGADRRPCAGLRVIEIGPYTAGPLCGRLLADLGAELIKIEPIGGDASRQWLPNFDGISGYFANYNVGKHSLALNFSTPQDAAILWQLLDDADVVIQNVSPGALERAGFGPQAVLAKYPHIVYCSISGYGATSGPRPAVDTVIQAASGIMTQVGNGDSDSHRPPIKVGISIADLSAAHIATLATLASLGLPSSAPAGGHIDLSMLRGMAWMTQLAWPDGNSHSPPAVTISCSDGFVVADAAHAAHAATIYLCSLAPASKSREEVSVKLRALGISSAPVNELYEVLTSTLTIKRNLLQWVTYRGQHIPILSSPHRWSATVPPVGACIGEPGSGTTSIIGCSSK